MSRVSVDLSPARAAALGAVDDLNCRAARIWETLS